MLPTAVPGVCFPGQYQRGFILTKEPIDKCLCCFCRTWFAELSLYSSANNPFFWTEKDGGLRVVQKLGEDPANSAGMKLGVFIERNGILNQARLERGCQVNPLTLDDFHVNAAIIPLLRQLKAARFVLIATTNQPGLSRGYQSRGQLDRMHQLLRQSLPIDDILVCPHDETDDCPCRKPKPGLLVEAAFKWRIRLDGSFVISDKWQDAGAARAAGCTSVMIHSPWAGNGHRDFMVSDTETAVEKILHLVAVENALTV